VSTHAHARARTHTHAHANAHAHAHAHAARDDEDDAAMFPFIMSGPAAAVNETQALTELDKLYASSANKQLSLLMHFHDGDQKQVVRSMLDTLVEGQFHKVSNCTIRSEAHINVLLFGLLPRLAPALQTALIETFADMIERHFRNAESCRRVHVTRHLVTLLTSSRLLDCRAPLAGSGPGATTATAATTTAATKGVPVDAVDATTITQRSRAIRALSTTMSPVLEQTIVRLLQAIGTHRTTIADVYDLFRPIVALRRAPSASTLPSEKDEACALLMIRAMEAMASQRHHRGHNEPAFFDLDPSVPLRPEDVDHHELLLNMPGIGTPFSESVSSAAMTMQHRRSSKTSANIWIRPQRVSGIVIPAPSLQKWPVGGYTVIVSLRPEMLDPDTDVELFTFRGNQGHGVTARVVSSSLVVTVCLNGADNATMNPSLRPSDDEGKQIIVEDVFGNCHEEPSGTTAVKGFTTIYVSHVYRTLWRSRLTVAVDGVVVLSKRLAYPPASQMTPLTDGFVGGPRGQLGRVLLLSSSLEKKDIEAVHTLLRNSNFNIGSPAATDPLPGQRVGKEEGERGRAGACETKPAGWARPESLSESKSPPGMAGGVPFVSWSKCVSLWRALYCSKIVFAYDARHFKILKFSTTTTTSPPLCIVMDTGPGGNDAYLLSTNRGTVPISGNTVGSIADAFACAGGSFRMLLPVLLMSVRDGHLPSFQQLSTFADILVPAHCQSPEIQCSSSLASAKADIGPSILSSTVSLLASLAKADARNLGLFLEDRGLESLNWIFCRAPSAFLSIHLWKACQKLCLAILSTLGGAFMPEPAPVFKLAVNLLLFDLKIWSRGSFGVHGRVLSDMHRMVNSDLRVASSVDVQAFIDSLDAIYMNYHNPNRSASPSGSSTDSFDDRCALRNAAVGVLEALVCQRIPIAEQNQGRSRSAKKQSMEAVQFELNEERDDRRQYMYSCVLRFVSHATVSVGSEINDASQDADTVNQNARSPTDSASRRAGREKADQARLAMGLVLECARIVVRLIVRALVEPGVLCLLYRASLHGCMWQLMLAGADPLRQMAITIMHLTLSVGQTHKNYLKKYVANLKETKRASGQGNKNAGHHAFALSSSPWDDSGQEDADARSSRVQNAESEFYLGFVSEQCAAQVYYCLQHAPFSKFIAEALVQALVDDEVEDTLCGDSLVRLLASGGRSHRGVAFVRGRLPLLGVILDLSMLASVDQRFSIIRMVSNVFACSGRNKREHVRGSPVLLQKLARMCVIGSGDDVHRREETKFGDFFGSPEEETDATDEARLSNELDGTEEERRGTISAGRLKEIWSILTSPLGSPEHPASDSQYVDAQVSRLSAIQFLAEVESPAAADMLLRYIWSRHEVTNPEDARVYHESINAIVATYPGSMSSLANIAAIELVVDVIETSAEALQLVDAALKGVSMLRSVEKVKENSDTLGSAGGMRSPGVHFSVRGRDGFPLCSAKTVSCTIRSILTRIISRLASAIEKKKVRLVRLGCNGAIRWEGASDAGLLWNHLVLVSVQMARSQFSSWCGVC
jgi:hypothetical protein